jgi:hypothetical protein
MQSKINTTDILNYIEHLRTKQWRHNETAEHVFSDIEDFIHLKEQETVL